MQEELKSLGDTNNWTLVEHPEDKIVIPRKWVYKVKTKAYRSLEIHKAHNVAESFKQIEGIDFSKKISSDQTNNFLKYSFFSSERKLHTETYGCKVSPPIS